MGQFIQPDAEFMKGWSLKNEGLKFVLTKLEFNLKVGI
jgi:hypothetical protein